MTRLAYDAIKNKKRSVRLQDSFFYLTLDGGTGVKPKQIILCNINIVNSRRVKTQQEKV